MKTKLVFGFLAAVALMGCSTGRYAGSSGVTDDIYYTPGASAPVAAVKSVAAEDVQVAQLKSKTQTLVNSNVQKKVSLTPGQSIDVYADTTYVFNDSKKSLLSDSYEDSYERRLRGMEDPSYGMESWIRITNSSDWMMVSSYDPNFYNIVVMGNEIWVEPKYVSNMFGYPRTTINFGYASPYYGGYSPWGWGASWSWGAGPYWGYPWYYSSWYTPYYSPYYYGWGGCYYPPYYWNDPYCYTPAYYSNRNTSYGHRTSGSSYAPYNGGQRTSGSAYSGGRGVQQGGTQTNIQRSSSTSGRRVEMVQDGSYSRSQSNGTTSSGVSSGRRSLEPVGSASTAGISRANNNIGESQQSVQSGSRRSSSQDAYTPSYVRPSSSNRQNYNDGSSITTPNSGSSSEAVGSGSRRSSSTYSAPSSGSSSGRSVPSDTYRTRDNSSNSTYTAPSSSRSSGSSYSSPSRSSSEGYSGGSSRSGGSTYSAPSSSPSPSAPSAPSGGGGGGESGRRR